MSQEKTFSVDVLEIHSGDDLILMVDLGVDGLHKRVRARLKGVDTPSAFKATKDTEAGAARDMLRELTSGKRCWIELSAAGKGGWIVTLFTENRVTGTVTNVNDTLISHGYVYVGRQEIVA